MLNTELEVPLGRRSTDATVALTATEQDSVVESEPLGVVSHGEFLISGFRNSDLRKRLFATPTDDTDRRRQADKVSRRLSLWKAHGLIKKTPHTQRYLLASNVTKHIPVL